jgi:uncharacterized protein (TIGR00645 family)
MERHLETLMYSARWMLAPIYLGLSLALLLLGFKFFQELITTFPKLLTMSQADLILVLLTLIDLALVGGLLVMVMLSGYENFVSRLNLSEDTEKLGWIGKVDSGSLKTKVAAAIVAISSIHLLKIFMDAYNIDNDKILWYVLMHLTFVVSAFGTGYLDVMSKKTQ